MASFLSQAKRILPERAMSLPILRGPMRGGRFHASARVSLRKVFGLYEAELNPWLAQALQRADLVVDVGANDGYHTFGCAAAMKRLGKQVRIIAYEPIPEHVHQLETAREQAGFSADEIEIVPKMVGCQAGPGIVTLDMIGARIAAAKAPLIKIDVEGAEIDVLKGAGSCLSSRAMLLIEVHHNSFLDEIPRMLAATVGPLDRVDQVELPLLGREQRDVANWWLLSRLPKPAVDQKMAAN